MRRRAEQKYAALGGSKVLPLVSYPVLEAPSAEGIAPYFQEWLAHPDFDEYWKRIAIEDHYAQIQVPVLNMGAWYDIFLGGTLKNYVRLKTEGGAEAARKGQRLLVYVGGHAGGWDSRKVGAVDFGEKLPIDGDELTLRWYDWLLKGEANGIEKEKPVRIFVMGKNEWREEDDWPLARAKKTKYFLHSAGAADGNHSKGALTQVSPGEEEAYQYVYGPSDAGPTIGGPLCCGALPPGIWPGDQRPAEARRCLLVSTTPSFPQDT